MRREDVELLQNGLGIVIVVLLLLGIGFWAGQAWLRPELESARRDLQGMRSKFMLKQGHLEEYGDYTLYSVNFGKDWIRVKQDDNFRVEDASGPVRETEPGLLEAARKKEKAWDRLLTYIEKNGPITSDDKEGLRILEDVGFEVEEKK